MATDFLGRDTKFPISGKFQSTKSIDTVLQDLQLLIATVPGERVNRPEYGCRLYTRVWDNIDTIARLGVTDIRDAIRDYEPRVDLISVQAEIKRSSGYINFIVKFTIVGTNSALNLVFPFQPQVR